MLEGNLQLVLPAYWQHSLPMCKADAGMDVMFEQQDHT